MNPRPVALIVEDNAQLLMMAELMVEEAGCIALAVKTSDEALAVLQARDDVRALFTDVQVPGSMNGVRLAFLVHERWPDIRLIVTSGKGALQDGDLPAGATFLTKPYDIAAVQDGFRELAAGL